MWSRGAAVLAGVALFGGCAVGPFGGSPLTLATNCPADGGAVAVLDARDGDKLDIYSIDASGRKDRLTDGGLATQPVFVGAGPDVLYLHGPGGEQGDAPTPPDEVRLLDPDTGGEQAVVYGVAFDDPDVSPDGTRLAVVAVGAPTPDSAARFVPPPRGPVLSSEKSPPPPPGEPRLVYVVDLAVPERVRPASTRQSPGQLHPAWGPNGRSLAYVSGELGAVPGLESQQVWSADVDVPGSDRLVYDLPPGLFATSLDWSSDGQLSLSAAAEKDQIVTFTKDGTVLSSIQTTDTREVLYSGGPDPQLLQLVDGKLARVNAPDEDQSLPRGLRAGRGIDVLGCPDSPK